MLRKAARLVTAIWVASLLCGCCAETEIDQVEKIGKAETTEKDRAVMSLAPDDSVFLPEESVEENTKDKEEPVVYQIHDVMGMVKMENEISREKEEPQELLSEVDISPSDTVKYIVSGQEEIMDTRQVESVVNENDPETYQIITTEQPEPVTEEIPEEYVDASGRIKYALLDGIWYEYKYSAGDLTLDEEDEELALLLLNLDGFYDGYEVAEIECEALPEDAGAEFSYHVLYVKKTAMEEAPADVENLTVSKSRSEITTRKIPVEEKVPVLSEEEYGTGEYTYYGWQELDGNTYYFDENGDRVTGAQVIQGIRHVFDEEGIRISRAGITVSGRNGAIDWTAVRESGIDYAMIRCGYRGYTDGTLILDSRCEENITGARNAGIETGIFFFSQAVTEKEAVEEASLITALAEKYQIHTPLVIESSGASLDYSGRADGLSAHDRTACLDAFCRTVKNAGYTPMIRAEKGWIENSLEWDMLSTYPFWLVQFNSDVTYSGPYEIWQYTGRGLMNGISGNIGLNISYGE